MQSNWSVPTLLALAALSVCLPSQKPTESGHLIAEAASAFNAAQAENPAWKNFQRQHGGEWMSQWRAATGTPRAIFGTGLPIGDWRENSLAEARRHATQLLRDQGTLLGLGTSEFREVIGSRVGRQWSFVYDQFFRGLPVIGGRADVRVGMNGRIAMFGSSAWPIGTEFDTAPQVGPEVATAAAWQALGEDPTGVSQPAANKAPRLVIWGDVEAAEKAPFHLAWEVSVSNVDASGTRGHRPDRPAGGADPDHDHGDGLGAHRPRRQRSGDERAAVGRRTHRAGCRPGGHRQQRPVHGQPPRRDGDQRRPAQRPPP